MILRTAVVALLVGLSGGVAHAQVGDDEYARDYDFIMSNVWVCSSEQPSDMIEGGTLAMNWELHFQRSGADDYNFTGTGTESTTVEGTTYNGNFNFEGFGINDSDFGTGVSIKTLTMTGGDPGWSWHDTENLQLHLEQQQDSGKWKLVGYQVNYDDSPPTQINFECGGPDPNG